VNFTMSAIAGRRVLGVEPQQAVSDLVLVVVFALLMAPAAQLKIEAEPVPYTLQVLFVLLTGLTLGPWRGAAAMLLYAVLGFSGLPVFARGGGPAYFLTPTAGYIYGFVVAAFVTGMTARVLHERFGPTGLGSKGVILRFVRIDLLAALAGVPFVYIFGVNHLALYYVLATDELNPWGKAWGVGAGIFIWYDVIKACIAGALVSSAGMRREGFRGNR